MTATDTALLDLRTAEHEARAIVIDRLVQRLTKAYRDLEDLRREMNEREMQPHRDSAELEEIKVALNWEPPQSEHDDQTPVAVVIGLRNQVDRLREDAQRHPRLVRDLALALGMAVPEHTGALLGRVRTLMKRAPLPDEPDTPAPVDDDQIPF